MAAPSSPAIFKSQVHERVGSTPADDTGGNTTFGAALFFEDRPANAALTGAWRSARNWMASSYPPQVRVFNWRGLYVGLSAGRARGRARTASYIACLDATTPDRSVCPFGLPAQFASVGDAGTGTLSDREFTGGARAGRSWQMGSIVSVS